MACVTEKEKEGVYKLWPANKTDYLGQLWQSLSHVHEVYTVCHVVKISQMDLAAKWSQHQSQQHDCITIALTG